MLSRIAESLFWIGRYVERADGTARLLDVHLQLLLEDPWVDEDTACRSLLSVMGSDSVAPHRLTRHALLKILPVDRRERSSIDLGPRECTTRPGNCFDRTLGVPKHNAFTNASQGFD